MSFNEETPLEDVLKYIKQATTTATYQGIPIYVDPLGLSEANKTMTSTVRNMDLEGFPLSVTLPELLLKPARPRRYTRGAGRHAEDQQRAPPLLQAASPFRRMAPLLLGSCAGGLLRRLRWTSSAQYADQ